MIQQTKNSPQTPLEKLISDKEHIRQQCALQEQKLNEDFSYMQENASSLLFSGISSLLFPNTKAKKNESAETVAVTNQPATPLGISDLFAVAQSMIPLAWDIARPLLLTWGIKKAQSWFTNLIFKKKK